MSTDDHEQQAAPSGINDTGDLSRIWDALEQIAGKIDGGVPEPAVEADPEDDDPSPATP
ncbi:hypothetical protein [Agrococcus jejuensis]|uniref:hypothetical protein n=1 Tax=Agrococcus jejuensis TaxID=399736 RepID=UPI0016428011|nr:hypothetical protein [Agrococcus jejuensis]